MSTYSTEGIILRRANFGEANLLLHIYTKDFGKIEAVGKSARKAAGKLKGSLEPFLCCDFLIVRGKKMDTVANSFILENFLRLRENLDSVLAASVIVEIADRMILPGYRDEKVFQLLLRSMVFINDRPLDGKRLLWLLILFFEINLLALSGLFPEIRSCVFCGEKLKAGKNYFSLSLGGIIDEACAKKCPDASLVDNDVIKLLKFLQMETGGKSYEENIEGKFAEITRLNVQNEVLVRSVFLMKRFIEFNLDQKINSLDVFCDFAREGN